MSAIELAEQIEALAAKATPGPWEFVIDQGPSGGWPMILSGVWEGDWQLPVVDLFHGGYDFTDKGWGLNDNATLIVTLRNAVPAITAALRAQERVEALKAENTRLREGISWAADIFANCAVEMGYCCCGEATETHGFHSGHSPVDQGAYAVERWQAEYAALKGGSDEG